MTVSVIPDWGSGQRIQATVTDPGYLINRGRKALYIDGRPLTLFLQTVGAGSHKRTSKPSVFLLRAAPDLRLAGIFMPDRHSIFVLASSKRPPFSFRNVPGRRLAVWYSLDGGSRWQTASWTISKASAAGAIRAIPRLQGLDEKTGIERLLEQGLIPEVKQVPRCASCTAGRISRQQPLPGARVALGSRATIEVTH